MSHSQSVSFERHVQSLPFGVEMAGCFNDAITLPIASVCFSAKLERVSTQSPQCMSWNFPVADIAVDEQQHDILPVH